MLDILRTFEFPLVLSVIFNFATPIIASLIVLKYYGYITVLERSVAKLMYDYEMAMMNKKKAPVVSTKVKKATGKKTPSLKSNSTESKKVEKVIKREMIAEMVTLWCAITTGMAEHTQYHPRLITKNYFLALNL